MPEIAPGLSIGQVAERTGLSRAPQDQPYGDRDSYIVDPFGHGWTIVTHVEDVAPEEMARRLADLQQQSIARRVMAVEAIGAYRRAQTASMSAGRGAARRVGFEVCLCAMDGS
jgi:hypothetical protein